MCQRRKCSKKKRRSRCLWPPPQRKSNLHKRHRLNWKAECRNGRGSAEVIGQSRRVGGGRHDGRRVGREEWGPTHKEGKGWVREDEDGGGRALCKKAKDPRIFGGRGRGGGARRLMQWGGGRGWRGLCEEASDLRILEGVPHGGSCGGVLLFGHILVGDQV